MHAGDFGAQGPVFVRERGQLFCLAHGGLVCHRTPDYPSREDTDLLRGLRHSAPDDVIVTYIAEGSPRYTPKTLLDISLSFVAEHVERVESLSGFPELVAERLFRVVEQRQKLGDPVTSVKALRLFCEAYGELVLKSLCLRDKHLLLSERMEEIQMFHQLHSLDLHGCRLGDSHEIFMHLPSFGRLVSLFLGDNGISDEGVRRLTAPIRIQKKGLESLQQLDLSCNSVSEKGLGFLTRFYKLQALNVSETDVHVDESLKKFLLHKMGMILSLTPLEIFSHSECKTLGWAEEVVNQWEIKAAELPKKRPKPKSNALQFYGREKFVREQLLSTCSNPKTQHKKPVLHFYKPGPSDTSHLEAHGVVPRTKLPAQTGKKRRLSMDQEENVQRNPPAKRQPLPAFTAEDLDLLNSY